MKRHNLKIDVKRIQRNILFERLNVEKECLDVDKDALFERYCVYDGQYEDAHRIKEEIVSLIGKGESEETVPWKFQNIPNVDTLSIKINMDSHNLANAASEIEGNTLNIEVFLPLYDEFAKIDIDRWKDELEAVLVHELSHTKIQKEGAQDNKFNEISEKILYSQPVGFDRAYNFIVTAYFSYFHEIQSYVSQIPQDIKTIMNSENIALTKESLLDALKKTNVYSTYSMLKEKTVPLISHYDDEMVKKIADIYRQYDEGVAEDISLHFRKYVKYFERQMDFAFRKIRQVFNYVLKENGLL